MSCTGNKLWYVCSKGDFRGCCSVDPCNTGVCPDDDGDDTTSAAMTTSSPSSSPETSSTISSTTETTASASSTEPTTQSISSTSTSRPPTQTSIAFPELNNSTTTTSAPSPENPSSDASVPPDVSSYNNKALIGGAVGGGLVAVILILLAVFWLVYRVQKRRNRRFRLVRWYGPQYQHDGGGDREKGGGVVAGTGVVVASGNCAGDNADGNGETVQGPRDINPNINTTPKDNNNYHTTPSTTAETVTPISVPNSITRLLARTPPSISSSPERRPQSYPHRLTGLTGPIFTSPPPPPPPSLRPLEPIPSSPSSPLTLIPAPTRRPTTTTPELGDTGFYRQRAELPTNSRSELINIPHGERMRRHQHQNRGWNQDTEREMKGRTHIITPDGAVLAANFERSPGCRDYATSFMQCYGHDRCEFDGLGLGLGTEFEDELPAYYPAVHADVDRDIEKSVDVKKRGSW